MTTVTWGSAHAKLKVVLKAVGRAVAANVGAREIQAAVGLAVLATGVARISTTAALITVGGTLLYLALWHGAILAAIYRPGKE